MPPEISAGRGVPPVGSIARRPQPDAPIHVWQHRSRPAYTNGHDTQQPHIESEISTDEVIRFMTDVNVTNAITVGKAIIERFASDPPTDDNRGQFGVYLDTIATSQTEESLHVAGFITRIKGFEGRKEAVKNGPDAEVPVLDGHYGLGNYVPFEERGKLAHANGYTVVDVVMDPVEGTTNASYGRPGSVSIIAGMIDGQIARIPGEDEARYMDRIVASPRVKRLGASGISLDASVEHNIQAVMRAYNLSSPSEVEAVVMDRPRNEELTGELKRIGVKLWLISSGDLVPALTALTADRPIISMGSGGKEEAIIAAIAAVPGGFFEGRYVDKNGRAVDSAFGRRMTLKDLLTGKKSGAFVSLASITGTDAYRNAEGEKFDVGPLNLAPIVRINMSRTNLSYNIAAASISGVNGLLRRTVIPR